MKWRKGLRAALGNALCVIGFLMARATPYREATVMIGAGGCRLVTDVIDQGNDDVRGYVVLFHGLAANKKVMAHLARGFASENLRVFVPDLPGHGRTAGPFSFERAESCGETLVGELSTRGAIDRQRTMLAGHSMGGAIALRVAARVEVAGVIAISPAPQRAIFPSGDPLSVPAHTLAVSGALEPFGIGEYARELVKGNAAGTGKYLLVPQATHVSVLFDGRVVHASQEWSAEALHFPVELSTPSYGPLVGSLAGLAGLLLLAGPFVREMAGAPHTPRVDVPEPSPAAGLQTVSDALAGVPVLRALLEVAVVSFLVVLLLKFANPLAFVRVYNGSYLASFGLIAGVALLLIHHRLVRAQFPTKFGPLLLALLAGFFLHLLVTGWLDVTFSESWISWARWARVPLFFVAALAYLLGEEILLGPISVRRGAARLSLALTLRFIVFLALVFGIFVLHSGAILIILLAVYLTLFFVLQRLGMDIVRQQTGSAIAAAVFGAILLAGFCLVIFPIT